MLQAPAAKISILNWSFNERLLLTKASSLLPAAPRVDPSLTLLFTLTASIKKVHMHLHLQWSMIAHHVGLLDHGVRLTNGTYTLSSWSVKGQSPQAKMPEPCLFNLLRTQQASFAAFVLVIPW